MNKLVVPPSPSWYETDVLACAPDNTLLYGSRQEIVIIKPTPENEPDNVQIISKAHSMRITSININKNWGLPHKYAVSVSEDKIVKLWDIETLGRIQSHNKHVISDSNSKVVNASFAGEDRIISVTENGFIVIWHIAKNETNNIHSLFDNKVTVTCLSVCPHATWLTAFGLKSGLIVVADLRRNGQILFKIRGHEKPLVSLSWCPAPVNIFPIKPQNRVVEKIQGENIANMVKQENKLGCNIKEQILNVDEKTINRRKQPNPKRNQQTEPTEYSMNAENSTKKTVVEPDISSGLFLKMKRNIGKGTLPNVSLQKDTSHQVDHLETSKSDVDTSTDTQITSMEISNSILRSVIHSTTTLPDYTEIPLAVTMCSEPESNTTNMSHDFDKESVSNHPNVCLSESRVASSCDKDLNHSNESKENLESVEEQHNTCNSTNSPEERLEDNWRSVEEQPRKEFLLASSTRELTDIKPDISSGLFLKMKRKIGKGTLPNVLLQKDKSQVDQLETSQSDVDTPTDRQIVSMEISNSIHRSVIHSTTTLPEYTEIPLAVTMCSEPESNTTKTSHDFDKESVSNHPNVCLSDESFETLAATSCEKDLNQSKESKENLESVEEQHNTSNSTNSPEERLEDNWRLVEEQPRKEFLLASSAREPNIYIWRAGSDGRMQTFLTLPNKPQKKGGRTDKVWITICWATPNILLSSSRNAELIQWTLPKPMDSSRCMRIIHKDHWSVLFSIKAPITYLNEYNFLQTKTLNAWTTGMDRLILNTDIKSCKTLAYYPALGGSVNCLTGSPLDPNRLAIGTGEGIIHVWDISREHKKKVTFSSFYQKILSSVTALAWHPDIETSIAWGTAEGRIGILDTLGKFKPSKILRPFFKSQIFKIEWGPLRDNKEKGLYVVCDGKIAIFDLKEQEKDPKFLELPDNTVVYTMSWKPDFSMVLVSSKGGALITYTANLEISNISYVTHKLQSIIWHPDAISDNLTVTKYCYTFASLIKSTQFVVYDLKMQSDNFDGKVVAHYKNHGVMINSIAWSPHSGSQLVFVDEDGVAQIYDIETKAIISTFINSSLDSLSTVCWSPVDPDFVITGSMGHKIIVWKVSENPPLIEKDINSCKNRLSRAQQKEISNHLPKPKQEDLQNKNNVQEKTKKSGKSVILPIFYSVKENKQVTNIKKLLQWKLKQENVDSKTEYPEIDVLDLFGHHSGVNRILDTNITAFRQQGKHVNGNILSLFKGDINNAIKEAIDQKRVNPWIISLCPMVSPKLWQTACQTYADQLLEGPDSDPIEIVTYLLACHKIEESVQLLCEREMFREALVLAKVRFGSDSSIVNNVLEQWAKDRVYRGNFEQAAECYIAMGKYQDAASVLFRRSNMELLKLAVELAELSGNENLLKAVLWRYQAIKEEVEKQEGNQSEENLLKDIDADKLNDNTDDNKLLRKADAESIGDNVQNMSKIEESSDCSEKFLVDVEGVGGKIDLAGKTEDEVLDMGKSSKIVPEDCIKSLSEKGVVAENKFPSDTKDEYQEILETGQHSVSVDSGTTKGSKKVCFNDVVQIVVTECKDIETSEENMLFDETKEDVVAKTQEYESVKNTKKSGDGVIKGLKEDIEEVVETKEHEVTELSNIKILETSVSDVLVLSKDAGQKALEEHLEDGNIDKSE